MNIPLPILVPVVSFGALNKPPVGLFWLLEEEVALNVDPPKRVPLDAG